jgi:hypothetical protein
VRSRPDLKLYLDPGLAVPGTRLKAQAVLVSRSETPIDGIEAHLCAREQRRMSNSGQATMHWHTHLDLIAHTPPARLSPGEHRVTFAFDIPPTAPPSYAGRLTTIEYDLHLRVSIPWWPDRSARYLVPVAARTAAAEGSAQTFCTDARGPQGSALYVEASVETTTIPLGGAIRGAVSLANVSHHRVRRVEVALIQAERWRASRAVTEEARYVVRLHEGAPVDGQPIPFVVALPKDAAVSFEAALVEVLWYLEVRAVIALGSDVVLTAPFKVARPAGDAVGPARVARVPPVGRERRAALWAESARRNGLANDADGERMSLDLGASSLAITLEPRKGGGLSLTASVTWPRLGIDLAVAERRWVDAWSGGVVPIDAPGFADRFTVRGREEAQVRAFLDDAICQKLLGFDDAAVGDEGATLVSSDTAQTLQELDGFVSRAVSTAQALRDAAERVPPPAVMAGDLPAWRSFAALLGGQLLVGEMSIHDAAFEEAPLLIATEWSKEGAPLATLVCFPLPERDGEARPLDAAARALVESLTPQLTALELREHAIEARLPAPLADPASLEPVLGGLGRLARRLSGGAARGPYR